MDLLRDIFYTPFYNLFFWLVDVFPGENLWIAIVALTVIVKLVLLPLSAKAVRAQRENTALQPKLDEIRKKHKDNPDELNRAMIALYQEHNVNPLSGCLPILIQMPILIVLYRVFIDGISTDHYNLLYSFIATPENLNIFFLNQDLSKPSIVLALFAGATQFLQTWQIQKSVQVKPKKGTPASSIGKMVYFMPILTIIIGLTLPSALTIYWITTTIFSIGQQSYLMKIYPDVHSEDRDKIKVSIRKK